LPPARWLAEYRAAWLPGDIVAGITEGIEDKVGALNRSEQFLGLRRAFEKSTDGQVRMWLIFGISAGTLRQ
jgi:hypothetical protein